MAENKPSEDNDKRVMEPLLRKLKKALIKAGDDEAIYNLFVDKPLEMLKLTALLEPKQIKHETDFRIHWVEAPKKEPLPVIDIRVIDEFDQIAEGIEGITDDNN